MKKQPLRKCVVSQERFNKAELIRVVCSKDGVVKIDVTGKAHGRGLYLQKDLEIIKLARKKNIIAKIFKIEVDAQIYDELEEIVHGKVFE